MSQAAQVLMLLEGLIIHCLSKYWWSSIAMIIKNYLKICGKSADIHFMLHLGQHQCVFHTCDQYHREVALKFGSEI